MMNGRAGHSTLGIIAIILLALGGVAQGFMLHALLNAWYWPMFWWHVTATCLFPWPLWQLMSGATEKNYLLLILFLLLCFFIPIISGAALLGSITVCSRYAKRSKTSSFNIIEPPVIPENIVESIMYTQAISGNIRAILTSSPEDQQRIRAVLATRKMSDQTAIPILQIALLDTVDEVRLLAYSMLNTKEKKISNNIQQKLNQLKNETSSTLEQANIRHYIAEAYWELAYLGLEQGQARIHVLETANQYAIAASDVFDTDIELYFLRGRISLELAQYEAAEANFKQAQRYGMPEERLLPYQAELAFAEHRLDDLRHCIQKIQQSEDQYTLSDIINQWI